MAKNNLIRKISKSLGVLAFSAMIGSGICYAKETNPKGYEIPDLSSISWVGSITKGGDRRIDTYKIVDHKTKKQTGRLTASSMASKGYKTFMYGIIKLDEEMNVVEKHVIADLNGDGVFETKYELNEFRYTDKSKKEYPAKKDLPLGWDIPPECVI